MKKVKAPKAKNTQPVILTMDTLIELVRETTWAKNEIMALRSELENVMDVASNAYPERTKDGLKFKYFSEDGREDFVTVKVD